MQGGREGQCGWQEPEQTLPNKELTGLASTPLQALSHSSQRARSEHPNLTRSLPSQGSPEFLSPFWALLGPSTLARQISPLLGISCPPTPTPTLQQVPPHLHLSHSNLLGFVQAVTPTRELAPCHLLIQILLAFRPNS